MTNLVPDGNQPLLISGDRVPTAAYQAIYHKLTGKIEKISEIFNDIYEITVDDICQLNYLLEQAIIQYKIEGKSCECNISLKENESFQYTSFEKFRTFNFQATRPTSEFNYKLDFFTILPTEIEGAQDIVQRFKVVVALDQDFPEVGMDNIPMFIRATLNGNNINLAIEYSDYAVARSLQSAVRDWVDSLKQRKNPQWIKILDDRADFLNMIAPRALLFGALLGAALGWSGDVALMPQAPAYILRSLAAGVVAYMVGHVLVVNLYKQLAYARPLTFILITKGDKDRRDKIQRDRRRKTAIVGFLGVIIVVATGVNIFSSYVYDWLT